MSSRVYVIDMHSSRDNNLLDRMERLVKKAGLKKVVSRGDLVAIKIHFGEPGNLAYIRTPYVRRMVGLLRELGAKPFLTDANTLYVGARANAVEHIEAAIANGFDYAVTGAPVIIADGLTGKDYVKVKVKGQHFQEVNIGSAAVHADAMVVMTHFKGHELTGFGGTLKNMGMGLGARSGKQQMHSDVLPRVAEEACKGCERCGQWCPAEAIEIVAWEGNKRGQKAHILEEKCWGCGECVVTCPSSAIKPSWRTTPQASQEKIAEYALGALTGKQDKALFISFVNDISPNCDCNPFNDQPVVQDVGMLASTDPVALDQACVDLVNALPALPGSVIEGVGAGEDKFKAVYPGIDWKYQLEHAERIGLGTRSYSLVKL